MRILRALPALLLLPLGARGALAQDECPVNVYQPSQLAQAGLMIPRAIGAATQADAEKALRDGMRYLQDERRLASNPVGAGYLRAQFYVLWLHQEGATDVMTHEQLNAGGDKAARVDLVVAVDSLLKAVEALSPACAEETAPWRQGKPWTERLNKAYQFMGSDNLDSMRYYLGRAALLHAESPFVYNLRAQMADKAGDKDAMLGHLLKAVELARPDTSLDDTRRQMQFQYAMTAQAHAMADGGARKDELLKAAANMFAELLREDPDADEAAYAFSSAADIAQLLQSQDMMRDLLAPMVADPSPYQDLTLIIAADMARMMQRNDDAKALYAGALSKNPNLRDANYFLSFMYYEEKEPAKMLPLARKLVELDPSNPDNYLLLAEALRMNAAAETDAAKKAQLTREADAAARTESAMPHKLLITQFERRKEGALLAGTIENRGRAAKGYTLAMEFLDAAGNVVEIVNATVASVAPNATGEFRLEPKAPGIVAYKYKAIE